MITETKERGQEGMLLLKCILYMGILLGSFQVGRVLASRYANRYTQLKECKVALSMLQTKIEYTRKPLAEILKEIAKKIEKPIATVYQTVADNIPLEGAGEAWENSWDTVETNLKKEDKITMQQLGKMLGKTNSDGQIKEIAMVQQFLETQIQEAQLENRKNSKLYKTLGIVIGMTLVLVLV